MTASIAKPATEPAARSSRSTGSRASRTGARGRPGRTSPTSSNASCSARPTGPTNSSNGAPDLAYLVGRIAPVRLTSGRDDPTDADDPDTPHRRR